MATARTIIPPASGGGLPHTVDPRVRGTGARAFALAREAVYPRVCGGTHAAETVVAAHWGLSPRVRGNRLGEHAAPLLNRSIPACAGEPMPLKRWLRLTGVYPRVCGGTVIQGEVTVSCSGLSPRVRGNPSGKYQEHILERSIPACAGEP